MLTPQWISSQILHNISLLRRFLPDLVHDNIHMMPSYKFGKIRECRDPDIPG